MSDLTIPVFQGICNTVTLTLAQLLSLYKTVIPDMKQVYDENLSYESTVKKLRADNQLKNDRADFFPCFSFRRSVLRYTEPAGPGKRSIVNTAVRLIPSAVNPAIPNYADLYHSVQADFDIEFQYFVRSIDRAAEFEITYLSEDGISQFKQFNVDLTPELGGPFTYFARYQPLESRALQFDEGGNYFKVITGKITVRGFYFLIIGTSAVIKQIQKQIYEFNTSVLLEQETIT